MRKRYFIGLFVGVLFLLMSCGFPRTAAAQTVAAQTLSRGVAPGSLSTADHSRFPELDRQFASGPEVTKACLKCHNLAALQLHDTIHWTWDGRKTDRKDEGKAKTLNNF